MSDGSFGIHGKALLLSAKRIGIISENIANSNTPGYKAKDIPFKAIMAGSSNRLALTQSSGAHISLSSRSQKQFVVPNGPSLDGNTVDVESEKVKLLEATQRYAQSLEFVSGAIKGRLKVIKGD
jgi:flagellar basal-body rod protein FlgB